MITTTADANASQQRRLQAKTQDQRLIGLAVHGAGISPWEADVLVDVVKEVYFAEPEDCPLRSGQTRYECVAATEGVGPWRSHNGATELRDCHATLWLVMTD